MSEHAQIRRLQEAELTPSPELWARLEGRLEGAQAIPQRRAWGWYAAAAACLLLALLTVPGLWKPSEQPATLAVQTSAPATKGASVAEEPASKLETPTPKGSLPPVVVTPERNDDNKALASNSQDQQVASMMPTASVPKVHRAHKPVIHLAHHAPADYQSPMAAPAPLCGLEPEQQPGAQHQAMEREEASLASAVAEAKTAHHRHALLDSVPVIAAVVAVEDTLQQLVALASGPGPAAHQNAPRRDSIQLKRHNQRQTLLNKINRAMRWLPGGSAWPTIRFEKSEVAIASARQVEDPPMN